MKSLALLSLAILVPSLAAAADKPVHVFILSGQSNMAGMNPKLGFEPETSKLFPDAEVVYFKVAVGGEPIRYWVSQWNDIAKKHNLDPAMARAKDKNQGTIYYQQIVDKFTALLKKHPQPASITFCWMQGERDAREKLDAAYGDALRQLAADLRRDLKQPNLNVVIGRLSDHGKSSNAPWQSIRKTQVDFAGSDPHGAWVDCDDLNNKEVKGVMTDDLHYTAEGYELLGRRFARQARLLIDGKKAAENGRPE